MEWNVIEWNGMMNGIILIEWNGIEWNRIIEWNGMD